MTDVTADRPGGNHSSLAAGKGAASSAGARLRVYVPPRPLPEKEAQRAHLQRLRAGSSARSYATATILRAFYTDHPGARWAAGELAHELGVTDRTIRRSLAKLPAFGFELVDVHEGSAVMPGDLPVRRYLRRLDESEDPGGRTPLDPSSLLVLHPDQLASPDPEIPSNVNHDLTPPNFPERQIPEIPTASSSTTPPYGRPRTHARVRHARATSRRNPSPRDHQQQPPEAPHAPLRLPARLSLEPAVWTALRHRYGGRRASVLQRELRLERYHQHPDETARALRTLLVRDTSDPLRLFRYLFREALRGEALCDRAAWVEADRAAMLDGVLRGAPLRDDSAASWRAFRDDIDARLSAVRLGAPESEHAQVLEKALAHATKGLKAAREREKLAEQHGQIARQVAADPRLTTPEERLSECDLRIDALARQDDAEQQKAAYLARLSDEELARHVQLGLEAVQSAARAGQWRAAENAAQLLVTYQREQDRRGRPPDQCTRVAPAPTLRR